MNITITACDIPATHSLSEAKLCVPYRIADDRPADAVMLLSNDAGCNATKWETWTILWIHNREFIPDTISNDLCERIMVREFAKGEKLTIEPVD